MNSELAHIQHVLLQSAEQLKFLAERIAEKGEPLTDREKTEIRAGLYPWLQDMQNEQTHFFLMGNFDDLKRSQHQVVKILEML